MAARLPLPLRLMLAVITFLTPLVIAGELVDIPAPVGVRVEGVIHFADRGTTFGELVEDLHIRARDGDFLDVDGEVLEAAAYPGRILLNGRERPPETRLAEGDRVVVVHGRDQTESTIREIQETSSHIPQNPQFYLGTAAGEIIITKGRVSGKVVSTKFHQLGDVRTPNAVALTFDDGPHPTYTPQVLRILEKFDVPATFFVIGTWAENYPELIQQELQGGHVIANHSYSHPTPPSDPIFSELPADRMRAELADSVEVLQGMGTTPYLFRPPGGSYSQDVVDTARDLGMRLVLWAVDPEDWRSEATGKGIAEAVLSAVDPGDIIILHDGGGYQDATVAALPRIIKGVRKMGLHFVSIGRGSIAG